MRTLTVLLVHKEGHVLPALAAMMDFYSGYFLSISPPFIHSSLVSTSGIEDLEEESRSQARNAPDRDTPDAGQRIYNPYEY